MIDANVVGAGPNGLAAAATLALPMGVRRIDAPIADGKLYVFVEATDEALAEIAEDLRKTNVEIQKKLSR